MTNKPIAVAILNWNGRTLLERYLPSVVKHSAEADVIVIDNASTDDSVQYLENSWPEVRVIQLSSNGGYAGGYNQGIKQISNPYVVLLNSDVEVTSHWLQPILNKFEHDEGVAAIQPKIKADKQRTHFEYAGASGGYIDELGYPFCRGRMFDSLEQDHGQYNEEREVFWSTGACLAVRNDAYWEVGGLDEAYFAHMEEIDLCWRLKRAGYTCWVTPKSEVFHLGGGTLNSLSTQKTFLNFRNNMYLLTLNLPAKRILPTVMIRLVLDGLAGIQFAMKGKLGHTWAIVRAHFAYYGELGRLLKRRTGHFPWPLSGVYNDSIIKAYFLNGKKFFSDLTPRLFSTKTSGNG